MIWLLIIWSKLLLPVCWNIADHQSLSQHAKLKRAVRHLDESAVYFVHLCAIYIYMNLYDWRTGYLQTTLAYDPLGWPRWPLPSPWISVVWHLQRWVKSKVAAFALNNLTSHCLVCLWFIFHVNCLKLANVSWCQKLCGVQVRKPSDKAKAQSKSGLAVGLPNC